MFKYTKYINESSYNKYEIICKIKENYLLDISGQNKILDAIENELSTLKNIEVINIEKIDNEIYKLLVNINNKILSETDSHNIKNAIFNEFNWLDQSGILIQNINEI